MRWKNPTSLVLRAAWSRSVRAGIATCLAVAAASYCSATGQIAPQTHDFTRPTTLGPTASGPAAIPLPIESLRAVHGLDLESPAKISLPALLESAATKRRASEPEQLQMPALVAPLNQPLRVARRSDDTQLEQPPAAPEEFKPEWRSSSKKPGVEKLVEDAAPAAPLVEPNEPAKTKPVAPKPAGDKSKKPDNQAKAQTKSKEPAAQSAEPAKPKTAATKSESNEVADTEALAEVTPEKPLRPLTRNQIYLRNKLRRVLTYYYRKPLNSRDHDAWEAMHGMLAYGLHSRIRAGGPRGESMTAIGWLCYNNACKRKQLMRLNDEGEIRAQYGVGLQGHMGQFLAMLAQCNVDRTYPIRVSGKEFTIEDLITAEKVTCYPNTELTFKLIALMHYEPSDSQWVNDRGEAWSIERLIEEELKQPVRGAACGGTHRLGGLSLAVRKRQRRDEPLDGQFLKAAQFTKRYEQYAFRLQNSDGSFSTEWFRGPGRERDIDRRCRTSGHLLEWLLYQIEDEQLTSNRTVRGVNYLTNLLYSNSKNEWETGPLCHALHALALYDQRVFKPYDKPEQTAKAASSSSGAGGGQNGRNSARRQSSRVRNR